jgi:hypothetical protein
VLKGTIDEVAAQAETLLASISAGAFCVPQDWDQRIDCLVNLPDGSVVGEMVSLNEVTERRIRATGERLRKRADGIDVPLVNEIQLPVRIVPR